MFREIKIRSSTMSAKHVLSHMWMQHNCTYRQILIIVVAVLFSLLSWGCSLLFSMCCCCTLFLLY